MKPDIHYLQPTIYFTESYGKQILFFDPFSKLHNNYEIIVTFEFPDNNRLSLAK